MFAGWCVVMELVDLIWRCVVVFVLVNGWWCSAHLGPLRLAFLLAFLAFLAFLCVFLAFLLCFLSACSYSLTPTTWTAHSGYSATTLQYIRGFGASKINLLQEWIASKQQARRYASILHTGVYIKYILCSISCHPLQPHHPWLVFCCFLLLIQYPHLTSIYELNNNAYHKSEMSISFGPYNLITWDLAWKISLLTWTILTLLCP